MARATATANELQIVHVQIDDLHPDPANPRKIGNADLDSLTRSLREFGFVQPILARHDDHVVIGGHQRLLAARRMGMKTVPVIYLDISLEQAHLLNLALNKISGDWDAALLGQMLSGLSAIPDIDLSLSGFDDIEITSFLKKAGQRRQAGPVGVLRPRRRLRTSGALANHPARRPLAPRGPPPPLRRLHQRDGRGASL